MIVHTTVANRRVSFKSSMMPIAYGCSATLSAALTAPSPCLPAFTIALDAIRAITWNVQLESVSKLANGARGCIFRRNR